MSHVNQFLLEIQNQNRFKKFLMNVFKKKPKKYQPEVVEKPIKIMNKPAILSWDNDVELLFGKDSITSDMITNAFISSNVVKPIMKHWKYMKKLAITELNEWIETGYSHLSIKEIDRELHPRYIFVSKFKGKIELFIDVSSDKIEEDMGGHYINIEMRNGDKSSIIISVNG